MRILFITAFYPPYEIGGWEQLVQDINTRLQARGHTTQVLTSDYRIGSAALQETGVERSLSLEADLIHYRPLDFFRLRSSQLERNLALTRQAIAAFDPDIVFIHSMWNLSRGIAWQAEQVCPGRVVYYIAGNWPYTPNAHEAYWQDPAKRGLRKVLKKALSPLALGTIRREKARFPLEFERVLCVSQAIRDELARQAGIAEEKMRVVYNGVEVDRFVPSGRSPRPGRLALLYAGSLVPHKGVHTAVQALRLLAHRPGMDQVELTIVGSGHPDYEARLKKMAAARELDGKIHFLPRVPREEMPALLQKFDALVFPSIWQEPLARMVQEAMAAGLVVIGTPTGGTPEILQHGVTGLIFQPDDPQDLANCLEGLLHDPARQARLALNGRQAVLRTFDIHRMIDEIETYLDQAARQRTARDQACRA